MAGPNSRRSYNAVKNLPILRRMKRLVGFLGRSESEAANARAIALTVCGQAFCTFNWSRIKGGNLNGKWSISECDHIQKIVAIIATQKHHI